MPLERRNTMDELDFVDYEAYQASLLDENELREVAARFSFFFMFTLSADKTGDTLADLVDFDTVIEELYKQNYDETFSLELRDWIDEEFIGIVKIFKKNENTLVTQSIDVEQAAKIKRDIADLLNKSLSQFFTMEVE